jgi:hypothetical protein
MWLNILEPYFYLLSEEFLMFFCFKPEVRVVQVSTDKCVLCKCQRPSAYCASVNGQEGRSNAPKKDEKIGKEPAENSAWI